MDVIKNRKADCHPDRPHTAKGMCYPCYKRKYHQEHAEVHCARSRKHYEVNKAGKLRYQRHYFLKHQYGLSIDDYETMVASQNNLCAICQKPQTESTKRRKSSRRVRDLVVDHNHITGEVRGFLCNKCNTGLWGVENEEWLEKALNYLWKESQ